ncbi:MAG: PAS domain-containing protein [Candidatus Synoicihabitans palmerolidicus]|nr:PAS domain-containing protein [Candidatus Synoicihabitans palmerolidicus]
MMQQEVHLKPLLDPAGHVAITVFDVTAVTVGQAHARQVRVELEAARGELADRVERLDASLREVRTLRLALDEHGQVAVFSPEGVVTTVNEKLLSIMQRGREELVGRDLSELWGGNRDDDRMEQIMQKLREGQVWRGDLKMSAQDGTTVWINMTMVPFPGADGAPQHYVAIGNDITSHVEAEQEITASLAEKEILLQEVHHRVKNNMQIISSMLQLQCGYLDDPRFKEIFSNCRSRVQSMAMVHEKLYQRRTLASVDFGEHVSDLSRMLMRSYGGESNRVELQLATEMQIAGY